MRSRAFSEPQRSLCIHGDAEKARLNMRYARYLCDRAIYRKQRASIVNPCAFGNISQLLADPPGVYGFNFIPVTQDRRGYVNQTRISLKSVVGFHFFFVSGRVRARSQKYISNRLACGERWMRREEGEGRGK